MKTIPQNKTVNKILKMIDREASHKGKDHKAVLICIYEKDLINGLNQIFPPK